MVFMGVFLHGSEQFGHGRRLECRTSPRHRCDGGRLVVEPILVEERRRVEPRPIGWLAGDVAPEPIHDFGVCGVAPSGVERSERLRLAHLVRVLGPKFIELRRKRLGAFLSFFLRFYL